MLVTNVESKSKQMKMKANPKLLTIGIKTKKSWN